MAATYRLISPAATWTLDANVADWPAGRPVTRPEITKSVPAASPVTCSM